MRGPSILHPTSGATPARRDISSESRWLFWQRLILIGCSVAVLGTGSLHLGHLALKSEGDRPAVRGAR